MKHLHTAVVAAATVCALSISGTALAQSSGQSTDSTDRSGEGSGEYNVLGIEKARYDGAVPSDRPGFGDTVSLVPKGYFEMESGLRYDNNQGGGDSYTVPSSVLLRTGLTDNIEFRLGFDGYNFNKPGADGTGNASVGFKIHVADETTYTPAISIQPSISLPAGDDQVAASKSEPGVNFIWAKSVSDKIGVGGNVNLFERCDGSDGNRKLETAASISSSYSFSDRFGGYAEYYGIFSQVEGSKDVHAINGGVTFLATQHTQFDTFVGTGLNDSTSNVFAGVGIAHLF